MPGRWVQFKYTGGRATLADGTHGFTMPGRVFRATGAKRIEVLRDDGSPGVIHRGRHPHDPDIPEMPMGNHPNDHYLICRAKSGGLTFFVDADDWRAVAAFDTAVGVDGQQLFEET